MEERIKYLTDLLVEAWEMYDLGTPIMSDRQWDEYFFELRELEKKSGITLPHSPTQNIIYDVVNFLEKVEHNHPMLSLDKTKSLDEVKKFMKNQQYVAMLKLDGLTCSLRYLDGVLVSAETRGDGKVGENILHNAAVIPSIPKTIPYKGELVVDGEVICKYNDFKTFEEEYKNPRNFAAGSIRLLDANECGLRKLTFVAWDMIKGFEENNSFANRLYHLLKMGFEVVPTMQSKNTIIVGPAKNLVLGYDTFDSHIEYKLIDMRETTGDNMFRVLAISNIAVGIIMPELFVYAKV